MPVAATELEQLVVIVTHLVSESSPARTIDYGAVSSTTFTITSELITVTAVVGLISIAT